MSRLPVTGDDAEASAGGKPAPAIRLTYFGLAIGLIIFVIFLVGDVLLPDWLGLDLDCLDTRSSRRSEAVEMVVCAASAGPKGWLFLAWLAAPMIALAVWLRRSVRVNTAL